MYSKQLTVTANQSPSTAIFPVQVYTEKDGWTNQFALFASEYTTISAGVVGLRTNDVKTISLTSAQPMTQFWSEKQLELNNMTLSSMQVGELIDLGVSANPNATAANSTSPTYIRIGEITNKTSDGVNIDFSYPRVDVTVVSINPASS
jgi:hypothetical protein